MKGTAALFGFLIACARRGERTALVTVTDVIGSASRAPGTHMAVSETGEWLGSLSGGCVEAAVVGEARRVIEAGKAELIRFGAGSRFIDIRLPCGGGLDLLIVPSPPIPVLIEAEAQLVHRSAVTLLLEQDGRIRLAGHSAEGSTGKVYAVRHDPDLRLCIIGHGSETVALARLARTYGAQVTVLTPDDALRLETMVYGAEAHLLVTPAASPAFAADPHTAVVVLFHDHDWEPMLLQQALASDAFYVGAMGSRGTHAARLTALERAGVSRAQRSRLRGPIGLIPATRDPDTLALSILSEIVANLGSG